MVKLTIVTVCLNAVKTIERTIKSVIKQNYDNLEYIIIDGASTDGTVNIIEKYDAYLSYWVSEPDLGIYDAMNKGIMLATGDYICFLNSDDWFEMDVLKTVAWHIEKTQADVIYGDYWLVSSKKKEYKTPRPLEYMYWNMPLNSQATFIKRKNDWAFDTRYTIAADYKLIYDKYMGGEIFHYVPIVLTNFSLGGFSSDYYRHAWEVLNITSQGLIGKHGIDKAYYQLVVDSFLNDMCHYLLGIEEGKKRIVNYINNSFGKSKECVLFGTGEVFFRVIDVVKNCDIEIKYVVDNDSMKWGTKIEGYKIKAPRELVHERNLIIFVMTEIYQSDMFEQISNMEIDDSVEIYSYSELKEKFKNYIKSDYISLALRESEAFRRLTKNILD